MTFHGLAAQISKAALPIVVVVCLILLLDRALPVLGAAFNFLPAREDVGGGGSEEVFRAFAAKIDRVRLDQIPDRLAKVRRLRGQTLDVSEVAGNTHLKIGQCGNEMKSRLRLRPANYIFGEVTYHLDEYCRRRTVPENQSAQSFLLAIGDSLTFGQNLEDGETYPSQLALRMPEVAVYNFGVMGSGPNVHVANFAAEPKRLEGIPQGAGVATYYFIDAHMTRVVCPASCLSKNRYALAGPYFTLTRDGSLENHGTFKEDRWFLNFLYWPFAHSALLNYLGRDFPKFSAADYDLFVALMGELRHQIESRLNLREFVFVFAVSSPPEYVDELGPRLKAKGFKIINYSPITYSKFLQNTGYFPLDNHDTARATSVLADWLAADLRPFFN